MPSPSAPGRVGRAMSDPTLPITTAAEALRRLEDLHTELTLAGPAGLLSDPSYLHDLQDDLASTEQLYVGLAVTEIATLRAELSGALAG